MIRAFLNAPRPLFLPALFAFDKNKEEGYLLILILTIRDTKRRKKIADTLSINILMRLYSFVLYVLYKGTQMGYDALNYEFL